MEEQTGVRISIPFGSRLMGEYRFVEVLQMVRKIIIVAVLFTFCTSTARAQNRPDNFGKEWVRKHPFTTMALCLVEKSFDSSAYEQANFSTLLAWRPRDKFFEQARQQGMTWHYNVSGVKQHPDEKIKERIKGIAGYGGYTGWLVWDEPKRNQMHKPVPIMKWLKEEYPDSLVYSNAYPWGVDLDRAYGEPNRPADWDYRDYLRGFVDIMDSDILMYDLYPFRENGETSAFFTCLEDTRAVAAENNVPYWTFIQSYADKSRSSRMPSESDLRMQAFSHLTYGFTGIAYFTYDDAVDTGMVDPHGNPRPIYYDAQRLNLEIANVGQTLRFLTSTDVSYLALNGNKATEGTTPWTADAGNGLIRKITVVDKQAAKWKDLLVGYFADDLGNPYLMITNLWHDKDTSAADRKLTVTVEFTDSMNSISRLSRETGQTELLQLVDHTLTLTLPGGTGDLFKCGSGPFVGLDK